MIAVLSPASNLPQSHAASFARVERPIPPFPKKKTWKRKNKRKERYRGKGTTLRNAPAPRLHYFQPPTLLFLLLLDQINGRQWGFATICPTFVSRRKGRISHVALLSSSTKLGPSGVSTLYLPTCHFQASNLTKRWYLDLFLVAATPPTP